MHTFLNSFTRLGISLDVSALSVILAGTPTMFNLHFNLLTRVMENDFLHDPWGSQTTTELLQHALSAMSKTVSNDVRSMVQSRTNVHARCSP